MLTKKNGDGKTCLDMSIVSRMAIWGTGVFRWLQEDHEGAAFDTEPAKFERAVPTTA